MSADEKAWSTIFERVYEVKAVFQKKLSPIMDSTKYKTLRKNVKNA